MARAPSRLPGATHSWRVLDAGGNQLPTAGATYHVAVYLQVSRGP
jgi:hypothetical protein